MSEKNATNFNNMLLKSDDLIRLLRTSDSINSIEKYIENHNTDSFLKQQILIDVVSYHIMLISNNVSSISQECKKNFDSVDWSVFGWLMINGQLSMDEDNIADFLFEGDDLLGEPWEHLKSFLEKLKIHFDSGDYLNYPMTMTEFFKWKSKNGRIYIQMWEGLILDNKGEELKTAAISKKGIIKSWKYCDKNVRLENKILTEEKDVLKDTFLLDEYLCGIWHYNDANLAIKSEELVKLKAEEVATSSEVEVKIESEKKKRPRIKVKKEINSNASIEKNHQRLKSKSQKASKKKKKSKLQVVSKKKKKTKYYPGKEYFDSTSNSIWSLSTPMGS